VERGLDCRSDGHKPRQRAEPQDAPGHACGQSANDEQQRSQLLWLSLLLGCEELQANYSATQSIPATTRDIKPDVRIDEPLCISGRYRVPREDRASRSNTPPDKRSAQRNLAHAGVCRLESHSFRRRVGSALFVVGNISEGRPLVPTAVSQWRGRCGSIARRKVVSRMQAPPPPTPRLGAWGEPKFKKA